MAKNVKKCIYVSLKNNIFQKGKFYNVFVMAKNVKNVFMYH